MKVAILGCGWLGLPLAERLVEEGHQVKGSVTKETKLPILDAAGIESFRIDLSTVDESKIVAFLTDVEVLIITVPPKHQSASFDLFAALEWFIKRVVIQKVPRVLYISSISVYEDTPNIPIYSEEKIWETPSEKAAKLLQMEDVILMEGDFQACVLRLGGLLGKDRHPIKYLTGRQNIPNPVAPVNLVHQLDCIGIIIRLLQRDWFDGILNVVHPAHPSKRDYYTAAAIDRNLPIPHFSRSPSAGKIVSTVKLQRLLNYTFETDI